VPSAPYYTNVLGTVRSGYIDVCEDKLPAIIWDRLDGPSMYKFTQAVTDFRAVQLIEAMLVEREQHINRIAELEDQVRSLEESEQATVWAALSPAEREQAIRGAA
jgi:hypothetical protein